MTAYTTTLAGIQLDRDSKYPLHRQLYDEIRHMILTNVIMPGEQLPPTRKLCDDLSLSRSTVVDAISQLKAEGYLEGWVGRGTFVSRTLPEIVTKVIHTGYGPKGISEQPTTNNLSVRGQQITAVPQANALKSGIFRSGMPDAKQFPFKIWQKLLQKKWAAPEVEALGYGDPAGYYPLRETVAQHVRLTRGVKCSPDQVMITAGAQQALYLTATLLLDQNDPVWVENPGYNGAHLAFRATGARLIPVPVDEDGVDVEAGIVCAAKAKLVYVCPSHQYPVGGTLPLTRRMQLLEWAYAQGAWILEDDYDSEYRYSGHPLASLQSLDNSQRVIYMGTFSKVMFPSLRLGYLILPPQLVAAFTNAREAIDRGSSFVTQMALHEFMVEGHFSRHIRRSRVLYAKRQRALLDAIEKLCPDLFEIRPFPAGMHLLGWLPTGWDDKEIAQALYPLGISAAPLSNYSLTTLERGGLLLGYAAHDETVIWETIKKIFVFDFNRGRNIVK